MVPAENTAGSTAVCRPNPVAHVRRCANEWDRERERAEM